MRNVGGIQGAGALVKSWLCPLHQVHAFSLVSPWLLQLCWCRWRAQLDHLISWLWTFFVSFPSDSLHFSSSLCSQAIPPKPCTALPLGLVFMFSVLCLIPLTIQCFLVSSPQLLHTCPVPPGTSASSISEHSVDVSILVTHWICSLCGFPGFSAGHISGHEGERNNCCRAQGSGCLTASLPLLNNLGVGH